MARVFKAKGITHVKNLGWLIRHARKTSIVEFRIVKAKYAPHKGVYLIVKFEDTSIYASRYASIAVCKRWLRRSMTLPHFEACNLKGFDVSELDSKEPIKES